MAARGASPERWRLLYASLGWVPIAEDVYEGESVTVMRMRIARKSQARRIAARRLRRPRIHGISEEVARRFDLLVPPPQIEDPSAEALEVLLRRRRPELGDEDVGPARQLFGRALEVSTDRHVQGYRAAAYGLTSVCRAPGPHERSRGHREIL